MLSFAGRPITTVNGFKNVLGIFPKGWRVPLSFRRDGKRRDVFVRLMGVHGTEELLRKAEGVAARRRETHAQTAAQRREAGRRGQTEAEAGGRTGQGSSGWSSPNRRASCRWRKSRRQEPTPKHVEKLIVKRPGYANYYFNELNRDRVWNALLAHGDFSTLAGTWKLTGTDAAGNKIEIDLGQRQSHRPLCDKAGGRRSRPRLGRPTGAGRQRRTAGRLAPVATPAAAWARSSSATCTTWAPRPCRTGPDWSTCWSPRTTSSKPGSCSIPATGQLIGMEMFPDDQVDPCEVYFDDYRPVDGRQVPHTLLVRHGDTVYAQIQAGIDRVGCQVTRRHRIKTPRERPTH